MEIMTTTYKRTNRQAALTGLAVVGFITLIVLGILLAIYSARFVPAAVSRVGSAAVYLTQVFTPAPKDTDLQVVPQIPFEVATSTATTSPLVTAPVTTTKPVTYPTATNPGTQTTNTYGAGTPTLYGQADLKVTITDVGYLALDNTNSFVSAKKVPDGKNAAVKFTVTNIGTNKSGTWSFQAQLPTTSSYTFTSDVQQSLNPNEHIDYVLGFDRARNGDRDIMVIVDSGRNVSESNEANNTDTKTITIE